MLSVERILGLHHPGMPCVSQTLRGRDQGGHHLEITNRRIFDGSVFPAGSFRPDTTGRDDAVTSHHRKGDATTGAHPDERIGPAIVQLLHGNGGGGPSDPGGTDGNGNPFQASRIGDELTVVRNKMGVIQMRRDLLHPFGIAGKDHIPPDIPFLDVQMVLHTTSLHIITHACSIAQFPRSQNGKVVIDCPP
jgi:hypothetical protein